MNLEHVAQPEIIPPPQGTAGTSLREQLRPLFTSVLLLTLITGVLFPLALLFVAQLFPTSSKGRLIEKEQRCVGSEWIAQEFTRPEYFHPRPSAAGDGYDPLASGGTNLGPNNPKFREEIQALAEKYRSVNGLAADWPVPADAVTRSGSGLDPHISPENAGLQSARIAKARKVSDEELYALVKSHTEGRQLGFLGQPRVNVLALNLALDERFPVK